MHQCTAVLSYSAVFDLEDSKRRITRLHLVDSLMHRQLNRKCETHSVFNTPLPWITSTDC